MLFNVSDSSALESLQRQLQTGKQRIEMLARDRAEKQREEVALKARLEELQRHKPVENASEKVASIQSKMVSLQESIRSLRTKESELQLETIQNVTHQGPLERLDSRFEWMKLSAILRPKFDLRPYGSYKWIFF